MTMVTSRERIGAIFRSFDPDGAQYLRLDQLKAVLRLLGADIAETQVVAVLHDVDVLRDGIIDYEKLLDWLFREADQSLDAVDTTCGSGARLPWDASITLDDTFSTLCVEHSVTCGSQDCWPDTRFDSPKENLAQSQPQQQLIADSDSITFQVTFSSGDACPALKVAPSWSGLAMTRSQGAVLKTGVTAQDTRANFSAEVSTVRAVTDRERASSTRASSSRTEWTEKAITGSPMDEPTSDSGFVAT